jgi:hypothetical protein
VTINKTRTVFDALLIAVAAGGISFFLSAFVGSMLVYERVMRDSPKSDLSASDSGAWAIVFSMPLLMPLYVFSGVIIGLITFGFGCFRIRSQNRTKQISN